MRLHRSQEDFEGPNMTPVIDVVFLLLIFFLVATRFDEEEREISTRLAEVTAAQPLAMPPDELIVNVTAHGRFVVAGKPMDEPTLAMYLHELSLHNPGTQRVQIRADERAPFRYPARVMGLCEQERIEHYCSVIEQE